jgi:SAM-dependent methyltransferase
MTDLTQSEATVYDTVAYPTAIFTQTHPDRLAVIAQLHDLAAADPGTARVLEVGCGDGMNLLAMAVAAPEASFAGFDLAPTVIQRGRTRAAAAGLRNVELEVRDVVEAARELEGECDYIIAHGLYAWGPEPVREALLALIGRVLAPAGIAFVSYNTLPGGYFRMAVRDLMRHFIPADADAATMLRTARAVLEQFAEPQPDDGPAMAAYRHQAARTLEQPDGLLFHDELGGEYHPQLHSQVCAAAAREGLVFLGDTGRGRFDDGFLPEGVEPSADVQAQIVALAQQRDFMELRYFRRSLFVRAEAQPRRTFEPGTMRGLWASSRCTRDGDGWRGDEGTLFAAQDPVLAAALDRLAQARPARLPVAGLELDDARLRSLLQLFDLGPIDLHTGPAPFANEPPDRPALSSLTRALIAEGIENLCTLDHSTVRIEDPVLRRFLAGLDGSRDAEGMQALAVESGFADPGRWREMLDIAIRKALIMRPRPAA